MPFINSKVSTKMSDTQKETVKSMLGDAISLIPGKSENWLMVGFEDNYDLYFQGNQNAPTAMIEVKIFGSAKPENYDALTARICDIFNTELSIPKDRIYVKYEESHLWGWNGSNF